MKILFRIFFAFAVVALLLAAIGLLLPRHVTVERSVVISAPAPTVFALVNGFTHFNRFSPWAARDPATAYTFTGPQFGKGAAMEWRGEHPEVGSGRQQVIESEPYEKVVTALDFGDAGEGRAAFLLDEVENGTRVTWRFETDFGYNPVYRWMGLMFDRWLGPDYERGLGNLKAIAESYPDVDIRGLDVERVAVTPERLLYIDRTTSMDTESFAASLAEAFGALTTYAQINELEPRTRLLILRGTNTEKSSITLNVALAIPTGSRLTYPNPGISQGRLDENPALRTFIRELEPAGLVALNQRMKLYAALHGLEPAGKLLVRLPEQSGAEAARAEVLLPLAAENDNATEN